MNLTKLRAEQWDSAQLADKQPHLCAWEARNRAYAPYSHYRVGACILTKNGNVYTGANIENSSYGLTICAERTAISQYILNAEPSDEMIQLWFATDTPITHCKPCGACLQFLAEFNPGDEFIIGHYNGKDIQAWGWLGLKKYFGKVQI